MAAEINSSFYRPHRPATYARWHDDAATACDEDDQAIYNPYSTSCSRDMRSAVSLLPSMPTFEGDASIVLIVFSSPSSKSS